MSKYLKSLTTLFALVLFSAGAMAASWSGTYFTLNSDIGIVCGNTYSGNIFSGTYDNLNVDNIILTGAPDWLDVVINTDTHTFSISGTAPDNNTDSVISSHFSIAAMQGATEKENYAVMLYINPSKPVLGAITGRNVVLNTETNIVYSIQPAATASSYKWTFPDNTAGFQANDGLSASVSFSPSTPSPARISVTATNSCGTSQPVYIDVEVLKPLKATFSVKGISCFGNADGEITASPTDGLEPYEYSKDNGATYHPDQQVFKNLIPGIYNVRVRDAFGVTTGSRQVVSEPEFLDAFVYVENPTCYGHNDGRITLDANGGTAPYTFKLSDGQENENGVFENIGTGQYSVLLTDANGCSATKNVTLNSQPEITLSVEQTVSPDDWLSMLAIITAKGGDGGPYEYSSDNITWSSENKFKFSDGTWSVLVRDGMFCTASITFNVQSDPEGKVLPTSFISPNGDYVNDKWVIVRITKDENKNNEVSVFDRFGKLINTFENYDNNRIYWDGSDMGGRIVPNGLYYYVIKYKDRKQTQTGWILVQGVNSEKND